MKSKYSTSLAILLSLSLFPQLLFAQIASGSGGGQFEVLLVNILVFTNDTLIPFIIGLGFLFFVWGMFVYFIAGGADEEKRAKGKSLVIHATLGFVLIIIFFGVVNMIVDSSGLYSPTITDVPTISVP